MTSRTTLDWYGCATFRLTIGELVVFLDAYIDRVADAPGTGRRADDIDCADLGLTHQEREARMGDLAKHFVSLSADVIRHLQASNQGAKGDGGALVFVFETPGGSILDQDTSGHWSGILHDLRPDVAILAAAGRGNVDGDRSRERSHSSSPARRGW